MKSTLRAMLAFTLCIVLCLGLVPAAFADGGSETAQEFGESAYAAYEGLGPYGFGDDWEAMLQTEPGELLAGAAPADGLLSEEGWRLGASSATVKLPAGTTVVEDEAFLNDVSITSVSIPKSVTSIGDGAFYGCANLKEIYYNGTFSDFFAINIGAGNDPIGGAVFYFINGTYQIPLSEAHFPDEGFRYYVFENFDSDKDGWLSNAEAAAVTSITCPYMEISSLKGVEFFPELTFLRCEFNNLTELDIRSNTKLQTLVVYGNHLSSLDVSQNPALLYLICGYELQNDDGSWTTYGNDLKALDVTHNLNLLELSCPANQLTTLDVSKNTALKYLGCWMNNLSALNVTKNTELISLACAGNPISTLNLSNNSKLQQLHCQNCSLTTLNASYKTALVRLRCFNNGLTSLNVNGCTALEFLACEYNQLTSLNVQTCTALKELRCSANGITSLNVSSNKNLQYLTCWNNKLTGMDLTQNTALLHVNLSANHGLGSVTFGSAENLELLWVQNTELPSLNISTLPIIKDAFLKGDVVDFGRYGLQHDNGDWVGYYGEDLYPDSTFDVDHFQFCVDKVTNVIT